MDYILNRRSVRKYDLSKKISNEDLIELCKYGEAAPSARRQKGREYIIVNEQEIINKLSLISKGSMILSECNTLIAVIGKDPKLLSTPHMQALDLSAATENILLAATKKGYGSCWIGIYPLEERISPCNEILGINDDRFVFSLIALGIPLNEDSFYDANKLNMDDIHFNRG